MLNWSGGGSGCGCRQNLLETRNDVLLRAAPVSKGHPENRASDSLVAVREFHRRAGPRRHLGLAQVVLLLVAPLDGLD